MDDGCSFGETDLDNENNANENNDNEDNYNENNNNENNNNEENYLEFRNIIILLLFLMDG